ncbi:MAG: hypothetical protein VKJ04_05560 [Vampirovibrionales bacterium]|nr:hypothetical protein [Vampirovibrionales bacterium]
MLQLGLIGENISHSVSPLIHRTLLAHTALAGEYGILDRPLEQLPDLFETLVQNKYAGVNVTVPHKQAVLPFLSQVSPSAEILGAVNTIVFDYEETGACRLLGHNTDVDGFWQSVPESQKQKVVASKVLLLGAGGAARAVLAAVLAQHPLTVTIAGQSATRLFETLVLAQKLNQQAAGKTEVKTQLAVCDLKSECDDLSGYDWVINATPIGTGTSESPLSQAQIATLPKSAFISDLVYHPRKTQLLSYAQAEGISGHNGLDMLIYQAMAAFTLWTGKSLDTEALEKVQRALNTMNPSR